MQIGINFRHTAGFVTDGTAETYCLHEAYPTTRGGATFGWEADMDAGFDVDSGADRRLAGYNKRSSVSRGFRLDLPAVGNYRVRIASGQLSAGGSFDVSGSVQDNTVNRAIFQDASVADNSFVDAAGVEYTSANWPANNALVSAMFTGTLLRVALIPFTGISDVRLAHLYVETAEGYLTSGLRIGRSRRQRAGWSVSSPGGFF